MSDGGRDGESPGGGARPGQVGGVAATPSIAAGRPSAGSTRVSTGTAAESNAPSPDSTPGPTGGAHPAMSPGQPAKTPQQPPTSSAASGRTRRSSRSTRGPETLPFGDRVCDLLGWDNWSVITAQPSALEWLKAVRTWDHTAPIGQVPCTLHEALILAPSRLAQTHHPGPLVRGLRAEESPQRQALLASRQGAWQNREGMVTWEPVWDWTLEDIWAYHAANNLPRSPVYDRLEAVGCPREHQRVSLMIEGHAVTTGRLVWLKRGWPDEWARLAHHLPSLPAHS